MNDDKKMRIIGIIIFVVMFVLTCFIYVSCEEGSCSGSSSYQLYNKDGTINWKYYNNMQDYFSKNP